jgi:MFS family permease
MLKTASSLSLKDYKVIGLSILGGALEVYDFIIFVFLSVTIADVFFPASMPEWIRLLQSMVIFSVGYIARPIGGLIIANYSDRHGRKRMFNFTVLFIAMPCLFIGVLPGYAQIGYWAPILLLLARVIQGAALGGEVPNAWVFVAEHAPVRHRGYALGLLQAGLTFGYMLAALTTTLITSVFTSQEIHAWAWRLPFIIGGLFGFISVWLRHWLRETPVFLELQRKNELAKQLPVSDIIKHHRGASIPAATLTMILTSAVIICVVVTPIALQKFYGMDAVMAFRFSAIAILFLNIGCIIGGRVSDWLGAWSAVAIYSVCLMVGTTLLCAFIDRSPTVVMVCYAIAGLLSGIISAVPAVIVQLFPPAVKVTGISLIYNIVYSLCSSVMPLLLLELFKLSRWNIVVFACVMGIVGLMTVQVYRKKINVNGLDLD